jgi:phosphoserine phosphatase
MNVLSGDLQHANELLECCDYCFARARVAQFGRDLDEAEKWVKEFLRCKRDLDELLRRKEEHDKLLQVVEMMKECGVDIAIITRRGNEQ